MEKEKNSFRYIPVMYFLLIAIAVPLFFILRPMIEENITQSGIRGHYALWKESRKSGIKADYTITLFSDGGPVTSVRRTSSVDSLHALLEALLLPLTDEEKDMGYVSYIPDETELVGVNEEDGFFFVSLNSAFLSTTDIKRASEQIKKTLEEYYTLESLTVISGNTVIKIYTSL